nr:hypothetical protein [Bradyrhizobium shewense]
MDLIAAHLSMLLVGLPFHQQEHCQCRTCAAAAARNNSIGSVSRNLRVNVVRMACVGDVALSPEALAVSTPNIQMRHVIGHNLRIADAAFAEHAADARLGETAPLVGDDILQLAEIGQMVVNGMDAWQANGSPPPVEISTTPVQTADRHRPRQSACLPAPGEHLLWGQPVSPGNLGNDRAWY